MRRWFWLPLLVLLAAGLAVVWGAVATWCQGFFGFANNGGNGSHYLFWSGAGSDLAYLSFLAAGGHVYWRFTCHEPKC